MPYISKFRMVSTKLLDAQRDSHTHASTGQVEDPLGNHEAHTEKQICGWQEGHDEKC